ncbi:hypothetical protein FB639_005384, partial [Coemansia asiatica]
MANSPESSRKRARAERQPRHSRAAESPRGMTTRSRSQSIANLAAKAAKTESSQSAGKQQRKAAMAADAADVVGVPEADHADSVGHASGDESASCPEDDVLTVDAIRDAQSDDELLAKLSLVFSDPCTLARSFPQTDSALASDCPVDVAAARRAYEMIFDRGSEK